MTDFLHRLQHRVDGTESSGNRFGHHGLTRHHAVPRQQLPANAAAHVCPMPRGHPPCPASFDHVAARRAGLPDPPGASRRASIGPPPPAARGARDAVRAAAPRARDLAAAVVRTRVYARSAWNVSFATSPCHTSLHSASTVSAGYPPPAASWSAEKNDAPCDWRCSTMACSRWSGSTGPVPPGRGGASRAGFLVVVSAFSDQPAEAGAGPRGTARFVRRVRRAARRPPRRSRRPQSGNRGRRGRIRRSGP